MPRADVESYRAAHRRRMRRAHRTFTITWFVAVFVVIAGVIWTINNPQSIGVWLGGIATGFGAAR